MAAAPPARRRTPWYVIALAITCAALLVVSAAAAVVVTRTGAPVGRGVDPAGPGDAGDVPANLGPVGEPFSVNANDRPGREAPVLMRLVPELMRFVETERQLPFTEPVTVTLLDDERFRQRVLETDPEDEAEQEEQLEDARRLLVALGLLERDVDLEKARDALLGAAVVGLYDPEEKQLLVQGTELTYAVRATLVHELTHALQDQHFDIVREDLDDADDESSFGLTAVVEGDATRIEERYLESLSPREQKQAERERTLASQAGLPRGVPPILLELLALPYLVGPSFAEEVVRAGGMERLNEATRNPPTTVEQVLDARKFLAGESMRPVEPPSADGPVFDEGVFGEYDIFLVLREHVGRDAAAAASDGWGGGRYAAWRDGEGACVRVNLVMDTPNDRDELVRSLRRAAPAEDWTVAPGPRQVTLTACG